MKRHAIVLGLICGLLAGGASRASAQNWGRPRTPSSGACFYEDVFFGGQYFCAAAGDSTPRVQGGANDRISSIQIFGNAEVTVFRDSDFSGRATRFSSSVNDLRNGDWNDRISSFTISARGSRGARGNGNGNNSRDRGDESQWGWGRASTPSSGVCFYEDPNYRGQSFCTATGSNLSRLPSGANDRISSMRVFGNTEITVFRDSDFRGRSSRFTSSVADLRSAGWNDLITSARVTSRGSGAWGGQGDWGGVNADRNRNQRR